MKRSMTLLHSGSSASPLFVDEVLGELQPYHQFADLRAGPGSAPVPRGRRAAQEPKNELRLPRDGPALWEVRRLSRRRFTERCRGGLPRLVFHARPPWPPSS